MIGDLFDVFDIARDPLLAKELQRYFRGEKIEEDNRQRIYQLLADAIIGILPHPEVFDQAFICPWGLKIKVIRAISEYANRWDSVRERISHWRIPSSRKKDLLLTVFRLASIDMALRIAAFRYLAKSPHLKHNIPLWVKNEGNVLYLKQLLDKCVGPNCKPEDIAFDAGGQTETTAKYWFNKGSRPTQTHIEGLAKAFAVRIPNSKPDDLLFELRRHYILHDLYNFIGKLIETDELTLLTGVLFHYSASLQEYFEREPRTVEENYPQYLLYCVGGAGKLDYDPSHFKHLWEQETDPEWRRDLVMASKDWFPRIVQRNLRLRGETVVSRADNWKYFTATSDVTTVRVDYISAIFINHEVNGDIALWAGAGNEAYDWDRKTEAELREAVQINSDNPRAHLDLGVFLAHASFGHGHPDEGFRECLRAAELRPKWYRPRMEIAHVLLTYKHYKNAQEYLEQATRELPYIPTKLKYTIGFAKMMVGDHFGALNIFERIIQKIPDHALALDSASYCCFMLGDTVKGNSLAKRARIYGISTTYDQYDVGKLKERINLPLQTICERVGCLKVDCTGRYEVEKAREKLGNYKTTK